MAGRRLHEVWLVARGRRHRGQLLVLVHLMRWGIRTRRVWELMHVGLQVSLLALGLVRMIHLRDVTFSLSFSLSLTPELSRPPGALVRGPSRDVNPRSCLKFTDTDTDTLSLLRALSLSLALTLSQLQRTAVREQE